MLELEYNVKGKHLFNDLCKACGILVTEALKKNYTIADLKQMCYVGINNVNKV